MEVKLRDVLEGRELVQKVLTDGYVQLIDVMPRLVPSDRTIEHAIVEAARVSTGQKLKDQKTDEGLIRYLYRNQHTSPFEQIEFKFAIRCPRFVKDQIIRHRTFSFNEFSQRYAEVTDDNGNSFYHPSAFEEGIRLQDKVNKQSSIMANADDHLSLKVTVQEAERISEKAVEHYKSLLEKGMSRETARFCLSNATWTTLYMKGNLHNLLHFLQLRMDSHAQLETRLYARAIYQLIKSLIPVTALSFEKHRLNAIHLSQDEVEAIRTRSELQGTAAEKAEFEFKLNELALN